jgi:hypothetical protein
MRRAPQLAFAVVALVVLATPASAGSAWDPNDPTGPLDIRCLGATFVTAGDTSRLTISFYDSFRTSALPTMVRGDYYPTFHGRGALSIVLTDFYVGFVAHRKDGGLIFVYADWGSICCYIAHVRTPSARVLRVTFPTIRDGADPTYDVRAESTWKPHGDLFRDRTRTIHLGLPPGFEP